MRILRALRLFRPRTLAQLGKADERLQRQIDALTEEVRTLKTALGVVVRRERQLRAIIETEYAAGDQPVEPPRPVPTDTAANSEDGPLSRAST